VPLHHLHACRLSCTHLRTLCDVHGLCSSGIEVTRMQVRSIIDWTIFLGKQLCRLLLNIIYPLKLTVSLNKQWEDWARNLRTQKLNVNSRNCVPLIFTEFGLSHSGAKQTELPVYLHSEELVHLRSNSGCITPGFRYCSFYCLRGMKVELLRWGLESVGARSRLRSPPESRCTGQLLCYHHTVSFQSNRLI
jgi:hypothetical protein